LTHISFLIDLYHAIFVARRRAIEWSTLKQNGASYENPAFANDLFCDAMVLRCSPESLCTTADEATMTRRFRLGVTYTEIGLTLSSFRRGRVAHIMNLILLVQSINIVSLGVAE
jgi:hypothetical protein